jgi:hypothetical protein
MKKRYYVSKYFEDANGEPVKHELPPWYKMLLFKVRDYFRKRPIAVKEGNHYKYIIPRDIKRK